MPKRDLYSILGVPVEADAETIKNAYRRLAIRVHPDAGNEPDPARFREAHEAYLILSDAARRRSYDIEVGRGPAQNFFGFHNKSSGPHRRLNLEIVLSREGALTGGRLPFEVPYYAPCRPCYGGA